VEFEESNGHYGVWYSSWGYNYNSHIFSGQKAIKVHYQQMEAYWERDKF